MTHHDTRSSAVGVSKSMSEPNSIATTPPTASTPWLVTFTSAISSTTPKRISSSPA